MEVSRDLVCMYAGSESDALLMCLNFASTWVLIYHHVLGGGGCNGGGGGGGSSYSSGVITSNLQGANTGAGYVYIYTYSPPTSSPTPGELPL